MLSMKLFLPALLTALILAPACGGSPTDPSVNANVAYSQTDLTVGTGKVATVGSTVTVNYSLWLYDRAGTDNKGKLADSGQFTFLTGSGRAIQGFDQAVIGMAVGGKRRATIPPNLAYGSAGTPGIPGNATLVFELELVSVS
jgi:FKBP-type peptidyl-prolyl cis-trans isomerase FkpA